MEVFRVSYKNILAEKFTCSFFNFLFLLLALNIYKLQHIIMVFDYIMSGQVSEAGSGKKNNKKRTAKKMS